MKYALTLFSVHPFYALEVLLLVQQLRQKLPQVNRVLVIWGQRETILLRKLAR